MQFGRNVCGCQSTGLRFKIQVPSRERRPCPFTAQFYRDIRVGSGRSFPSSNPLMKLLDAEMACAFPLSQEANEDQGLA